MLACFKKGYAVSKQHTLCYLYYAYQRLLTILTEPAP
jgi:hypothetical protein